MTKWFAYAYRMRGDPAKIREVVPRHVAYWRGLDLEEYRGGPFSDRTGGLITFGATELSRARDIVENDPFVLEKLVASEWVKEWVVE